MNEDILNLFTSVTAGGVAGGLIIYLSRTWLSERLKNSIAHEYQIKLEGHKAELKAEQELAIEKIKLASEKERAIRSSAQELLLASRQASHDSRIEAVKSLWGSFLELKKNVPSYISIADLLNDKELKQFIDHPPLAKLIDDISIETINNFINSTSGKTEDIRPFIGELLYSYFFTYRAFVGSIMYGFLDGKEKGETTPWYKVERTLNMLNQALGEEVVSNLIKNNSSNFSNIQSEFEKRIIEHSAKIISGEESATFGLEQASLINKKAAELLASSQPNN